MRRSQAVIASVLVGIVLLLNAMAACPSLHELFHHDAGQSQHQCAVTLFGHGQVESAPVDVPVVASLPLIQTVPSLEYKIFSPAIDSLPAGRGPPVLPAVS